MTTGRFAWLGTTTVLTVATLLTLFGPFSNTHWVNQRLLFSIATVSAVLCIVAATIVIALADRREMAEIGLLGSALMATSVMPLVHGLVTPDVLYNDTAAFRTSSFLALPIAVAVAAPLMRPHSNFGRWAARRWREWTLLSMLGVFGIAAVVVFFPDAIVAPPATDPLTIAVTLGLVGAIGSLSLRQLRFFDIGGRPSNLVASLSLMMVAGTALLPLSDQEYSPGFWWLHIAGAVGVVGACVGLGVSKRMSKTAQDMLGPVLARDPLVAFELGLSPVVHQFVASLDDKDTITRDHVIRTAEMAIRVGERFRMSARQLRDLGLAAMLHDVGKLNTPTEVLTKPSRLTAEEYELIKLHAVDGEQMLVSETTLRSVAPIVRSHHERMDGRGYPDGLVGRDIPLPSRIIAVCDALDAMTHDRQYRKAMPVGMAFAVLNEHAGSQWDAAVIEQVMTVLPTMPTVSGLDEVGRAVTRADMATMVDRLDSVGPTFDDAIAGDTVSTDIGELLVAVDAEI